MPSLQIALLDVRATLTCVACRRQHVQLHAHPASPTVHGAGRGAGASGQGARARVVYCSATCCRCFVGGCRTRPYSAHSTVSSCGGGARASRREGNSRGRHRGARSWQRVLQVRRRHPLRSFTDGDVRAILTLPHPPTHMHMRMRRAGNWHAAVQHYTRAVAINPDSVAAYSNRAQVGRARGWVDCCSHTAAPTTPPLPPPPSHIRPTCICASGVGRRTTPRWRWL